MASEAAALLDQLMGRSRNAMAGEEVQREHWSDPEVCKYFLCGFCPSELFTNTRSDIGPCDKLHDETLQIAYAGSSQFGKVGYEEQFLECLEKNVRDLDKRIQRGKDRLNRSAEANKKAFIEESGTMYSEKLHELSVQITDLIHQSEELGNRGNVEEAQELILRVEELEKEKERERSAMMFKANVPQTVAGFEIDPGNFHEKNEICDVCGCFLIIGDTQARMDAHLMGKQHMGFARIRSKIVELKQAREERIEKEREERKIRRESKSNRSPTHREKSRSPHGSRRRSHRSRSRDRRRSRSRDHDRKKRSKSRERDRKRSRSRSRERKRSRSRSRDKKRSRSRSRDRDRKRSRSRSRDRDRKRSRSRSRDRRRRSRSGERRRRSRSREGKRSHSRDSKRRRRSRSRSRERNRKKDRRSRSRERSRHSRHHRSRSRSSDKRQSKGDKDKDEGKRNEGGDHDMKTDQSAAGFSEENGLKGGTNGEGGGTVES